MSEVQQQPPTPSTRRALGYVYAGYAFRYLYLLVLIPFYGRVLGAEEYGRLLAAMSLFQVVWLLCEYGFPITGARDTAATDDRTQLGHLYGQHMAGRLWLSLPCLVIGLGGTALSPLLREQPLLGVLATLNGLVAAFNLGWYFQGTLQFRTSVALEVLGFCINLPIILLLVRGPGDAWIVMATLLTSGLITLGLAHVLAMRSLERAAIRLQGGWRLIVESSALFVHRGVTMLLTTASTYLLSLFATPAQVGWYGAAERIAAVGLSLMQPANQVLVGTVSKRISSQDTEESAYRLMRKSFVVMTGFGLLLTLSALMLAAPLVPIIMGPAFGPTVGMLYVLAVMFPFVAFAQVATGYVLVPLRQDNWVSGSSLSAALLSFGLMVGLGMAFAGMGVAWARVVGQVVLALILLAVLAHKGILPKMLGR